MQKLSDDIREVTESGSLMDIEKHLRETAKKWASYVLDNNSNEVLEKGLAISRSIVEYLNVVFDEDGIITK